MNFFFNDDKNRDVIKIIGSFLDFVSLGNFLKSSKIINHACKSSLPHRKATPDEIHKALDASHLCPRDYIKFYDTRIINTSCFYRPIEVIIYDDEFHVKMAEHYFVINDKKQGHYKLYWSNGNLQIEWFYKDDRGDGVYKQYYQTGKLMQECFFKDGQRDGSFKEYYENGDLSGECLYENGKFVLLE